MAARKPAQAEGAQTPAKPYEPTEREREAIAAHIERRKARTPAPSIKLTKHGNTIELTNEHENETLGVTLLMSAVGTTQASFLDGLLTQLANAGTIGCEDDPRGINFMLSVIKGVEPEDEIEGMLAAQMAAVHMATMTFARRLANIENIPQQDSAEKAFNKLARTFTAQVEALKRYRTGGEQKMTVEHVTVNDGGQAIVGHVTGRGPQKK